MHEIAAQSVDRPVVDDAEHPGADAAAVGLVAQPAAPDREERLLGDVLGGDPVAHHPVRERERGTAVAVVEHLERPRVALLDQGHDLLVGEVLDVVGSGHHVPSIRAPAPGPDQREALLKIGSELAQALLELTQRATLLLLLLARAHEHQRAGGRATDHHGRGGAAPVARVAHGGQLPVGQLLGGEVGDLREPALEAVRERLGRLDGDQRRAQQGLDVGDVTHPGIVLLERLLELLDGSVDQHLRGPLGAIERTRDLAVVHAEGEAHDQRLAPVVGKLRHALQHILQLLAALHEILRVVRRRDDRGVLELGLGRATGRGSSWPRGCARSGSARGAAAGRWTRAARARSGDALQQQYLAHVQRIPIKIKSFTAHPQNDNSVLLKWASSFEISSYQYVIQKSKDGRTFSDIGDLQAAGNSVATINYSFSDREMLNGAAYYRLKLVDLDGSVDYTKIIYINNGVATLTSLSVFPNPFRSEVQLKGVTTSEVNRKNIKVYNAMGSEVNYRVVGGNSIVIDPTVPKGIYFLRLKGQSYKLFKE